ncbi:nucleolar and spindle-associated protein 1-like [Rhineura floridana]|uniref:nucleolar and spindle-associated protein 1-like n=1 Tax=Rhineura floridana TaxID=261503 RepID=UPI002AC80F10|nr:nucleolar and spindle-associated protein 1-like [Rhineura floridana]
MEVPTLQYLEALSYSELRRLAKTVGLKANLNASKLLSVLKQHFLATVQENGSMVKKGDSSTNTEELNSSPRPVNLSMVTKRHRKRQGDDAQGNSGGKNVNEEKTELPPEKEILTEETENEGSQDAGSRKTLKISQNEHLVNGGIVRNLAENSDTPSQQKERNSRRKGVEKNTLVDPLSEKKSHYPGNLSKSGKTRIISTTPNFKKLHEAQFKKMQSIDDYIERKNKMICNFSNSVNEVKMLAQKSNYLKTSQRETPNSNSKKRSGSRGALLSPHPQRNKFSSMCTPVNVRRSSHNFLGNANKSILSQKSMFNSTSLSTTKMNVRFSESTKDNEHKRSLTKTPSRKSPFLSICTPASQKSTKSVTRMNFKGSATKCQPTETPTNSAVSPFEFQSMNTKKPIFDLQASLSSPLSYQPHRGKLEPWGKSKENLQSTCSHKRNYKQPLLQTREERREKHAQERKQRKDQVLGTRRGLNG